jgi:cell division protein FtsQ
VHVKSASDVKLVPREGNEIIHIGALSGYEYKLDKLKAFYRSAYPAGVKSPYSDIDLRYSNQIVCKRK